MVPCALDSSSMAQPQPQSLPPAALLAQTLLALSVRTLSLLGMLFPLLPLPPRALLLPLAPSHSHHSGHPLPAISGQQNPAVNTPPSSSTFLSITLLSSQGCTEKLHLLSHLFLLPVALPVPRAHPVSAVVRNIPSAPRPHPWELGSVLCRPACTLQFPAPGPWEEALARGTPQSAPSTFSDQPRTPHCHCTPLVVFGHQCRAWLTQSPRTLGCTQGTQPALGEGTVQGLPL